eukprot:COSAG03_NODE_934_length_5267_cov_19.622485_3_plen_31_part_00
MDIGWSRYWLGALASFLIADAFMPPVLIVP